MNITSAAGILSLLEEPAPQLKAFALKKLNVIVDEFWHEISDSMRTIEALCTDETFPQRELAALVASKVYFHLGSLENSLIYALRAESLFETSSRSEYVNTLLVKCFDYYKQEGLALLKQLDPRTSKRLEFVVNDIFDRCLKDRQFKQALGLALETCRIDIFERAIVESDDVNHMLSYAFFVSKNLLHNRVFRGSVLETLFKLYAEHPVPDYINMCQCLIYLGDDRASEIARILQNLIRGSEYDCLVAYQIGLDLYENTIQRFLAKVMQNLHTSSKSMEELNQNDTEMRGRSNEEVTAEAVKERTDNLIKILRGDITIDTHLQFLIRHNHTDLSILTRIMESVHESVCHNAAVIANGFMHSGTARDQFLTDNLEWLARATNWAKLTAIASLGVIHRGNETEALDLMKSYTSNRTDESSSFIEGGGYYALGLIHANHGSGVIDYLYDALRKAPNEIICHGCCLGIGLTAMGTCREDIYDILKKNLDKDDAIIGEAAGIAIGVVMFGSYKEKAIVDMIDCARTTSHEKITRGLAVGIALTAYGRLEEADELVEDLCADGDPVLRRCGAYTLTLAYCGTGNNRAIQKLLHMAVSDSSDDVRLASVTGLGFILSRTPEQCPTVVSLLSESYNPHVRYGAAMALGIACAGSGLLGAVSLLESMTSDPVDFVRQGAFIASAMVLIQQNENTCPKSKDFRALYAKVINDKYEGKMAKFGAILGQGIIDAGGRNVTMCLQSQSGHTNMLSVVGVLLFTQYWYWYPLAHCLSLAFTPTCLVALNAQLKMPELEFCSNAPPSLFAYPKPMEEKKPEEPENRPVAVLSIAARARRREADQRLRESEEMETREERGKEKKQNDRKRKRKQENEDDERENKVKNGQEYNSEILKNPARVMKRQLNFLQLVGRSYIPVKDISNGGIILVHRTQTDTEEKLVERVIVSDFDAEGELQLPEPFEWTEN